MLHYQFFSIDFTELLKTKTASDSGKSPQQLHV